MEYCSRLILCYNDELTSVLAKWPGQWRGVGGVKKQTRAHIVFILGGNGIDEIILEHVQLTRLVVFAGIVVKVGLDLVRELKLIGAAHQGLLDGLFDAGHGCIID